MEKTAFDDNAPPDERIEALGQLQKAHAPRVLTDLISRSELTPVIEWIKNDMEDQAMAKSLVKQNVIPFPEDRAKKNKQGMQSVFLDDFQININGDYFEKPGIFTYDSMRDMVEQTPILNAVIMTRIRQIQRFCHISGNDKPGFSIRLKDDEAHPNTDEKESIKSLQNFFLNCGWEPNPRRRQRLKRANFAGFMAKLVRDSLTLDSAPIETEYKRDRSLGIDGLYAVDGATIRLCSEEGYRGDDEIFALQVVQGRVRSAYTYEDLIYVPRNPRTDVLVGGYGLGETELLIRVVTGFLNAFSYNTKYFDANAIPKGMLHLSGDYSEPDIAAFKRYWNAMVKGVSNAWTLPVMVSKDQESKAAFERFGVEQNEMMFSKWMTFLTSIICAIYGIGPDEINFESFTAGHSSLSGSDTEEKLSESKDKGLVPLLTYFSDIMTDYIVSDFGDKYAFIWNGLEDEDPKQSFEEVKLCGTVNELRAARGEEGITEAWGEAPLNPVLVPVWQAEQQQDFGEPGDAPEGQMPGAEPQGGPEGEDFGQPEGAGGEDAGGGAGGTPPPPEMANASENDQSFAKSLDTLVNESFGLPAYVVSEF